MANFIKEVVRQALSVSAAGHRFWNGDAGLRKTPILTSAYVLKMSMRRCGPRVAVDPASVRRYSHLTTVAERPRYTLDGVTLS